MRKEKKILRANPSIYMCQDIHIYTLHYLLIYVQKGTVQKLLFKPVENTFNEKRRKRIMNYWSTRIPTKKQKAIQFKPSLFLVLITDLLPPPPPQKKGKKEPKTIFSPESNLLHQPCRKELINYPANHPLIIKAKRSSRAIIRAISSPSSQSDYTPREHVI